MPLAGRGRHSVPALQLAQDADTVRGMLVGVDHPLGQQLVNVREPLPRLWRSSSGKPSTGCQRSET